MFHKLKNTFGIPKIKQQIHLIFLLSSIIPITIFGLFTLLNARKQMLSQYESQLETDAIRVNSTLFDLTTSIRARTSVLANDQSYWQLFNKDYGEETADAYEQFSNSLQLIHKNTAAVSSICMYTDNPTIPENDYIHVVSDGFLSQPWHHSLRTDAYNTWLAAPYTDQFGNTIYELTLVEEVVLKSSPYNAYLVTRLDSNYIRNRLVTGNNLIMTSIDDGPIFFSSDRSYIWQDMPLSSDFHKSAYQYTGSAKINGQKLLTSVVAFLPYQIDNCFYILVCDYDAYSNINQITGIYLIILLFALFVPAFLVFVFSSYFSGRIQVLRRAMHQASLGDYNIIDTFHGDDELADTFRDLKTTVDQIHEKEAKYYQSQINEQQLINNQQQMEFKMLASQINPHFLYNTLETIRMQAIASGNRDVADSIRMLGKTMHYVLENTGTDSTTIARELEHVTTYLKIQKLRFGDRVNYEIAVPLYLDLTKFHILPLLLQPIVENAVIHGLESVTQNGLVVISFILEEPDLYITITDNGEGMDEQAVEHLKEHIQEKHPNSASSIGLRNIDHRLKLLYGSTYGLTIESKLHSGTTLTLTLPLSQIIEPDALSDILTIREQYWEQDIDPDDESMT